MLEAENRLRARWGTPRSVAREGKAAKVGVPCVVNAKVVCDWMGNSEAVARKHYLSVTEDQFELAARSGPTGGPLRSTNNPLGVDQGVVRQPSASNCKDEKTSKHPVETGASFPAVTTYCHSLQDHPIPPRGVEPLSSD